MLRSEFLFPSDFCIGIQHIKDHLTPTQKKQAEDKPKGYDDGSGYVK